MNQIALEPLAAGYCPRIAQLLSTDEKLHAALSPSKPMEPVPPEEYLSSCRDWEKRRNAILFAILLDGEAIGTISLCDIDPDAQSARCGYWLGSVYWGKRYMTHAFDLIIEEAKRRGIRELTCGGIINDNAASIAIWKRWGARLEAKDGRIYPRLTIG